ncbi:hypothetical protein [Desulfosporosinus fructosivorans]|uniref:hypothetical protein n=1 Tax=Desulfosporosinus fructosivorans TaxID=2018669 RepID=UPI00130D6887|nr:hypothetical protein [Desulfosporosinus fructosivorans]
MEMVENYVYKKEADWSLLNEGLTYLLIIKSYTSEVVLSASQVTGRSAGIVV